MTDAHKTPEARRDAILLAPAPQNPAALYLANLRSPGGRYQMACKLDKVSRMLGGTTWQEFPWEQLTSAHVTAVLSKLSEDYKPSYINAIRAALRGVTEQAYDLRLVDEETYRLIRKVKAVKGGPTEPTGRYVPPAERDALMRTCLNDPTEAGRRDAAILACAYPGGLRRAEITALDRTDVEDEAEMVTLNVRGKGRKMRRVFLDDGGAEALRDWLATRGDEEGALFWAGRRGGHLVAGQRLSAQSVYNIVKRRAEQAGVPPLGTHDLRRSVASDLLDITDAVTVAAHLGHASTDTTARYDRRGERARRKAVQRLHIAYAPKERA